MGSPPWAPDAAPFVLERTAGGAAVAVPAGTASRLPGVRLTVWPDPAGDPALLARAAPGARVERDGRRRCGLFPLSPGARLRTADGAEWLVRAAAVGVAATAGQSCGFCRTPFAAGAAARAVPWRGGGLRRLCAACAAAEVRSGRETDS
jgi:hypothetical protein